MIYIKLKNWDFYDDAVVMVKSFYPRTDVKQLREEINNKEKPVVLENDIIIEAETPEWNGRTKRDVHDEFKKNLYIKLNKMTGLSLPWGYMTGVRPGKNAMIMLEEGKSDEEIYKEFIDGHFVDRKKAQLALGVAKKERTILNDIDYKNGYSLYIGIPFCPTTCLYCSFTSYSLAAYKSKVDTYIEALFKEMEYVSKAMKDKRLDTIYFGGGTPTTLSDEQLDRVLTKLEQLFDVENTIELTVEAGRPDSITREKLKVLKKHNVDRISINPQTMNQKTLDLIGRRHTVEQIKEAFMMAREEGFDNINMDMILGLPEENVDMVKNTLSQIKELSPESLTVHSLAIKRAAALNVWRDKYQDLSIENNSRMVELAADYAESMNMEPYYMYRQKNMAGNYENVGYSIPGKECIYNVLIMEEKQTIIACGAGASSKIVFHNESDDNHSVRIERVENVKDVTNYIERIDEMVNRKRTFFSENCI